MSTERRILKYFLERSDMDLVIDRLIYLEEMVTELLASKGEG